jgi:hypothetical protein
MLLLHTPSRLAEKESMKTLRWKNLRCLLFAALGVLCASTAHAQPSDAQIRKDLSGPGVISVNLFGRGAKVWSSTYMQYFWEREASVVRKAGIAEYPNATLEVGGFATYTRVSGGWRYQKMAVTYNRYVGIPAPSQSEVLQMVNADLEKFLGYHYNKIVGDLAPVKFPAKAEWYWHTPNSVSFNLVTSFTEPINFTQTEKKNVTFEVRIYRDSIKGDWNRFISTEKSSVSLGKTTHDADDLKAMPSLAEANAERAAKAQLGNLPSVEIPALNTDLEVFSYLHNAMRAGDAKKFEAILRRMLGGSYRAENSETLLDARGEELVANSIKGLFGGKSTYAEQYGEDLNVKHYQPGMLEFWNADAKHFSRIEVKPEGGQWKDGAKVNQKFAITDFGIWVATDKDEIARLRSMSTEKRFAAPPDSQRFSSLGKQVETEKRAAVVVVEANNQTWTPYSFPKARMQLSFPAAPKETEGTYNGKPMWTFEATNGKVLCRAISILYPNRPGRGQSQNAVADILNALAADFGVTEMKLNEISSATFGRVAVYEKDDKRLKARVWVEGDVLYQLILSSDTTTMDALDDRAFFGSFSALR